MSEPLFLQSVMQEKIWGGTKLRDVSSLLLVWVVDLGQVLLQ